MHSNVRQITEIALLAALITITGSIKLPSIFYGMEFQLSAPLAVAICAVFGFKPYIIAGCISSLIALTLGIHTILHVFVALIFRLIVGLLLKVGRDSLFIIVICGPIASVLARFCLSFIVGKAVMPLIAAVVPGCIFTAVCVVPMVKLLRRVRCESGGIGYGL